MRPVPTVGGSGGDGVLQQTLQNTVPTHSEVTGVPSSTSTNLPLLAQEKDGEANPYCNLSPAGRSARVLIFHGIVFICALTQATCGLRST